MCKVSVRWRWARRTRHPNVGFKPTSAASVKSAGGEREVKLTTVWQGGYWRDKRKRRVGKSLERRIDGRNWSLRTRPGLACKGFGYCASFLRGKDSVTLVQAYIGNHGNHPKRC